VTSHYVSGVVRFPVALRPYRRYEDVTEWERFVAHYFPDRTIPVKKKARATFHKEVDAVLLDDPTFRALRAQFQTKIDLAIELIHQAEALKLPFDTVVFDSWYLAEELVTVLKTADLDWISLVKKKPECRNEQFCPQTCCWTSDPFASALLHFEDLVALTPANAYRRVVVKDSHDLLVFHLDRPLAQRRQSATGRQFR
jgi:hypothetical protein